MASCRISSTAAFRALLFRRCTSLRLSFFLRANSSTSTSDATPTPPLLQKIKTELKTAMRNKDTARLSVLRSVLSATLNASKTSTPITTDTALVGLLKKQERAGLEARDEFRAAGRDDLVKKEEEQVSILQEYVKRSGVVEMGEEELRGAVEKVVKELEGTEKAKMGDIMKRVLEKGGLLDGVAVEKSDVARMVKQVLG